ncbi:hypothetical protein FHX82_000676 [Amycolatopsis bartoniae]|uniref:hypothetical protein n=1 Tax=Amycolatopsis bartoniae TaxID=941986 RepID=UPI001194B184|nr:hypothetical protein [Amycolatopsis bartoniae]MBB2933656.1 hypothetical protein [Amycolatopsis bartoniae]TVT10819.1 hypothetical protein FNH07_04310 [Amycolatopsis bartoniae]
MNTQPKLHQPRRALVAAVEVVLAAVAIWGAFPLWHHAVRTLTTNLDDGVVLTSTRLLGDWVAASIGLGLVAALLLVDAVREVLLAVRAKHRPRNEEQEPEGAFQGHLDEV